MRGSSLICDCVCVCVNIKAAVWLTVVLATLADGGSAPRRPETEGSMGIYLKDVEALGFLQQRETQLTLTGGVALWPEEVWSGAEQNNTDSRGRHVSGCLKKSLHILSRAPCTKATQTLHTSGDGGWEGKRWQEVGGWHFLIKGVRAAAVTRRGATAPPSPAVQSNEGIKQSK